MCCCMQISSYFHIDLTRALDRRLDTFITNSSWPAYKVWLPSHHNSGLDLMSRAAVALPLMCVLQILNNISMPFDGEVGDHTGLFPIAFLARAAYYNLSHNSPEWIVALKTASQYVVPFTPHLADGTFSRTAGWDGQVCSLSVPHFAAPSKVTSKHPAATRLRVSLVRRRLHGSHAPLAARDCWRPRVSLVCWPGCSHAATLPGALPGMCRI